MSADVHWPWDGEVMGVQCLEEGKLLDGRKPRKVKPRAVMAAAVVISLLLQLAKRCPTKPMEFQH